MVLTILSMRVYRTGFVALGTALLLALTGCAAESAEPSPQAQTADAGTSQSTAPDQGSSPEPSAGSSETSIPAGAYAASADFAFPVPEGWAVLEPFVEGTLGKDVAVHGSVEYPGDAKAAAATYLELLKAAGFNAYTYGPGELTNQASLAAEGTIGGTAYTAILNFDVHADGLQHVSIAVVEDD